MKTAHDAVPDTPSFLDTLADVAEARQSRAGAFVWVHAHLIRACAREGYCASQIYRALDTLGFHPPMSERQFRRYVRLLKQPPALSASSPPRRHRLIAATRGSPARTSPSALGGTAPSPQKEQTTSASGATTFDWDPTKDVDDLR